MRKIVVVGAGQGGLLLALGLLDRGYQVTLVSDRTPDDILHGPVPAGSVVFHRGLALEHELGVDFWDDVAVACEAIHLDLIGPDGQIALSLEAGLHHKALCVDQRLKSYRWLAEVARRGGQLVVKPATIDDLERYAREHDLVVVATGRGPLASLFARDPARSPFSAPQRHVSMVVVAGTSPWANVARPGPKFVILPGVGELFSAPIYTKDGAQARFLGFEAIPGSPMDRFGPGMDPDEQLALSKQVLRELTPWDYDAIRSGVLVDVHANLYGRIVPTVRHPVATLPSGAHVMGIADTVNIHDPIAGQGANNAAIAARNHVRRIVERGDQPFDPPWMTEVFEEYWSEARYANMLAEKFLAPPAPHAIELLMAATQAPEVAERFLNGIAYPPDLYPWFHEPAAARSYLDQVRAAPTSPARQSEP